MRLAAASEPAGSAGSRRVGSLLAGAWRFSGEGLGMELVAGTALAAFGAAWPAQEGREAMRGWFEAWNSTGHIDMFHEAFVTVALLWPGPCVKRECLAVGEVVRDLLLGNVSGACE